MKLKPLNNGIIFQFVDDTKITDGKTHFAETTEWGFELKGRTAYEESTKRARWGIVTHTGKDVPTNIKPGLKVLIEPLKWTTAFNIDQQIFWKTDYDQIIATADD